MVSSTDLRDLRKQIIRVATNAGEGHIPSALSILDLCYVLHDSVMRDQDRMILSKGHGCLALYVTLVCLGRMPQHYLDYFCDDTHGALLGHPERDVAVGIEATTGSLGHGIGMSAGIALALRIKHQDSRVFCIVGDGECEEGVVWETALIAARLKLSNLTVLVDANGTSPNSVDGGFCSTIPDKFRAFGWFVSRINGHDHQAIRTACQASGGDRPFVIVCDTIKGKGVSEMEREPQEWHHKTPGEAQMQSMLERVT